MPQGSRHSLEGLLLRGHGRLILQKDDGGRWRLDVERTAERWLGRRVRVDGIRNGFDELLVERIAPVSGIVARKLSRRPFLSSWEFASGVLSAMGLLALIVWLSAP